MKLSELAQKLNCKLEGNPDIEIRGLSGLEEAGPGQLTFLANPRYRAMLPQTRASAILIAPEVEAVPIAALRSDNPYLDFARALELFYQAPVYPPGVHPSALIAPSAHIAASAHIGPFCFVDEAAVIGERAVLHSFVSVYWGARIGEDFFAHSHVSVREGCQIGHRVIVQNGVVIGGDGFGFAKQADGTWHKIPQTGTVVIADDVEIQANSAIDRATVGQTRIGRGSKIDDLVLIGHASHIGEDALLCGQAGLAGSTTVGNKCVLAGRAASAGHLKIADGAVLTAGSAVSQDVPEGAVYSGSPAFENKQWLRSVAVFGRLGELHSTVRELQREVQELRAQLGK